MMNDKVQTRLVKIASHDVQQNPLLHSTRTSKQQSKNAQYNFQLTKSKSGLLHGNTDTETDQ